MAEIQKNITKRGKRNGVSRMFQAKNDKETIATWRSDLNRILHVFNVRSIPPARPLLTVYFQTELAINTSVVVSGVHRDVLTTQAIVSNIHRNMVEGQEGTDGKIQSVSFISLRASPSRTSPFPRLNLGW